MSIYRRRFLSQASIGTLKLSSIAGVIASTGLLNGCAQLAGLGANQTGAPVAAKKQGTLNLNGGQFYYEEAGSGPAVVLLHGFTLDTRMWDDQFDVLAQKYRVIRYDLRGFGKSSLPSAAYSHADDYKAVLEALGLSKAHVVGLSAGGRVALDVALKHPSIVNRLVVIDTFVGGYIATQAYRDSFGAMIAAARGGDIPKAKALWLDHPLFKPAASQPNVTARLKAMVDSYSGFHWAQTNPETLLAPPAVGRLAEIAAPTLVLVGEKDIEDVQVQTELLANAIKGAQKAVITGAGHMANMEGALQVNTRLLQFLG